MKKIQINVQGRVQGVGFRYTTKLVADELKIKGTVRNEEDGSVSIEACGEEKQIEQFINKVKSSPSPAGRVTFISIKEAPFMNNYTTFKVIN